MNVCYLVGLGGPRAIGAGDVNRHNTVHLRGDIWLITAQTCILHARAQFIQKAYPIHGWALPQDGQNQNDPLVRAENMTRGFMPSGVGNRFSGSEIHATECAVTASYRKQNLAFDIAYQRR